MKLFYEKHIFFTNLRKERKISWESIKSRAQKLYEKKNKNGN